MNDTAAIVFGFILFAFALFMFGNTMGKFHENDRIYNNCLTTNGTMAYNEADKMCKDIVK